MELLLTANDVMGVFGRVFAAESADLKQWARTERNPDPLLQRFDANPLMETPFVAMADGCYLARSVHLVAQGRARRHCTILPSVTGVGVLRRPGHRDRDVRPRATRPGRHRWCCTT